MIITGVIAEYNPFHFGHKYQLEKIREDSDYIVAIMSGPFVQRGEAAITDKWSRAKAAVLNGVDLVIELPVIYALNTAQKFAHGGVYILNRTNVVNRLCFGSECGDINILKKSAQALENEPESVSKKIKKFSDEGFSYPVSREKAFKGIIPENILSSPNNILALEYIRAIIRLGSNIEPITIKRIGAGYNETNLIQPASATGIRKMIFDGKNINIPYSSFDIYNTSALDTAVTACIRTITPDVLSNINEVSEGLENRIISAAMQKSSINDIANKVKTKRYTMSRIKRILISSLLNITQKDYSLPLNYLRVLAMNENGAKVLKMIKEKSDLTIITKAADYQKSDPVFELDIKAQNIFALCGKNKTGNADFFTSPVIIK